MTKAKGGNVRVHVNPTLHRAGENEELLAETFIPKSTIGDSSTLHAMAESDSKRAPSCIYCDSGVQLSNEHVIPLALGGMVQIWNGSCEECRLETQKFENSVLNGEMSRVRYVQGLPSRSKHQNVDRNATKILSGGLELAVDKDDAPALLTFPVFGHPKFGRAEFNNSLELLGTVVGSYGVDPVQFLEAINASEVTLVAPKAEPVAFARLVAKIAFGFAWLQDFTAYLEDPRALVQAFMRDTDRLGEFVGTLPEPYTSFPGVVHRVHFKVSPEDILYAEVQLFAASAAPTYLVVLGKLKKDHPFCS